MTGHPGGTLRFWGESGINFRTVHAQQGALDLQPLLSAASAHVLPKAHRHNTPC
jgi:hypothetical protein